MEVMLISLFFLFVTCISLIACDESCTTSQIELDRVNEIVLILFFWIKNISTSNDKTILNIVCTIDMRTIFSHQFGKWLNDITRNTCTYLTFFFASEKVSFCYFDDCICKESLRCKMTSSFKKINKSNY